MNKDAQALIYAASAVSIIASICLFARGKRDTAIFVGLWAPTLLGLGTYFNTETHLANTEEKAD